MGLAAESDARSAPSWTRPHAGSPADAGEAAEISSLYLDADDPDGAPTPAWQSDLRARQRESIRHDPLPRVPHARAVEAEAGLRYDEAAD